MIRRAVLPLGLLLAGCSVSAETVPEQRVLNTCQQHSDCGDRLCRDGTCQSARTKFDTVLFEVTPPSMSGPYTGVAFRQLKYVNLVNADGVRPDIELSFEDVAEPAGVVAPAPARGCSTLPSGGTLKAQITFTPTEQFLGLPSVRYGAETTLDEQTGEYRYKLRLPPGTYDIYVAPDPEQAQDLIGDEACRVVPQIFREQFVPAKALELPLYLPAPTRLAVTVNGAAGRSLEGWIVDMIDHVAGRPLSNSRTLGPGTGDAYSAELWYSTPSGGSSAELLGSELVRVRPPEDQSAPTLHLQRDGLELFAAGEATINELKSLPPVVTVEGKVETYVVNTAEPKPVPATITLVATRMMGMDVGSASFVLTRPTERDGKFSVRVPPGEYRVYAEPERTAVVSDGCGTAESQLAAQSENWTIAATPEFQAGRTIQLRRNDVVLGRSVLPTTGEPLIGATIEAVPSACIRPPDVLSLDVVPFAPRATSGSVCSADGRFSFSADTGTYDLSIRPPEGSGWPWLVLPTIRVPTPDLGELPQTWPVHFRGSVRVGPEQAAVPRAVVRAFVFIDAEGEVSASPEHATWVLAVGETRTDDTGSFDLLLPEDLSGDPSVPGMGEGGCF